MKLRYLLLVTAAVCLAPLAYGQAETATDDGRLIRRFDFEEAETDLVEFPSFFTRTIAEDRGFPRFGRIHLTDETAAQGRWSLAFELDGGSLEARVPTGVIPILPLADYVVAARIKTSGLRHARARLAAGLADASGVVIAASRVETAPIGASPDWQTVVVAIDGAFPNAADLVIELQVQQPPVPDDPLVPRLVDINGRVWFDEVTVWHLPRIELTSNAPYNVVTGTQRPQISVLVRDLAGDALTADLRVIDLAGETIWSSSFPAPRGRQPLAIELPIDRYGWFLTQLDVRGEHGLTGRAELPLAILPPPVGPTPPLHRNPLAVVLPDTVPPDSDSWPALVRSLRPAETIVSLWDIDLTAKNRAERLDVRRAMIERLLTDGQEITFALERIPDELARARGVDPAQVLELLNQKAANWRAFLDDVFVDFGLRVRRWQVGSSQRPDAFWKPDLIALVTGAQRALAEFIPDPQLIVPFNAEQEVPAEPGLDHVHILMPPEITPGTVAEYVTPWSVRDREVQLRLELLDRMQYGDHAQVVDLVWRVLFAWREGVPRMAIAAPWRQTSGGVAPEPAYAAWRGLADALTGRTFAGSLSIDESVHVWLMAGTGQEHDAIVAWAERPNQTLEMVLADGPVPVSDLFGNRTEVAPDNGAHVVPLSPMPVIIERVDLPLARFRAGFMLDPAVFPAKHRVHESVIVLRNPWDVAVSGTIRLQDPPGVRISPRRHEVIMRPGEEIRLPVSVILDRSIVAGPKRLVADVRISADREHRLRLHTDIEVGWPDIDLQATWSVAHDAARNAKSLVITLVIANRGTETLNLDAFFVAPGVGQNRRAVSGLTPGASAVKTFTVPEGITLLSRRTIRIGVAERDGIAQLNRLMTLPDLSVFVPESVTSAD